MQGRSPIGGLKVPRDALTESTCRSIYEQSVSLDREFRESWVTCEHHESRGALPGIDDLFLLAVSISKANPPPQVEEYQNAFEEDPFERICSVEVNIQPHRNDKKLPERCGDNRSFGTGPIRKCFWIKHLRGSARHFARRFRLDGQVEDRPKSSRCANLVSMTRSSKSKSGPPKKPQRAAAKQQRRGYWLLQDAKARFSELVRKVRSEGPQHVTVHGRDEVVVIAAEDFRRLKGNVTGEALIEAMQASPYRDVDIAPKREPLPVRDISL